MSKRIPRSYARAWKWASASENDPRWVRWFYRIGIFGSPLLFVGFATAFGLGSGDWFAVIFFYLFILIAHPFIIVLLYHEFWEILNKSPEE